MEPWLSGTVPHADPVIRAVLHSFQQVRQDLEKFTTGFPAAKLWESIDGVPPLGFQLRHIAGSVERLTAYAVGDELTERQLAALRRESEVGEDLAGLLAAVDASLSASGQAISTLADFTAPRFVGRQRLPTTVGGLLVHLAEHTQRHLGQAILTCKLAMK